MLPEDPAAVLDRFCRQLQNSLTDCPVVLSVEGVTKGSGLDPDSGQTPALLASFSGRVWAEGPGSDALAAFSPSPIPYN